MLYLMFFYWLVLFFFESDNNPNNKILRSLLFTYFKHYIHMYSYMRLVLSSTIRRNVSNLGEK